jgi:hypothetical protein
VRTFISEKTDNVIPSHAKALRLGRLTTRPYPATLYIAIASADMEKMHTGKPCIPNRLHIKAETVFAHVSAKHMKPRFRTVYRFGIDS